MPPKRADPTWRTEEQKRIEEEQREQERARAATAAREREEAARLQQAARKQQQAARLQQTLAEGIPPPPPITQAERAARERTRAQEEQSRREKKRQEVAAQQARREREDAERRQQQQAAEEEIERRRQEEAAEQARLEQHKREAAEEARRRREQEPQYPSYWGDTPEGEALKDTVRVVSAEQKPELWAEIQSRVSESLEDFEIEAIDVVRNKELWRKYDRYKKEQAWTKQHRSFRCECYTCAEQRRHESWDEHNNEMRLFHAADPVATRKIIRGNSGFDARLGRGEYGDGAYFALHAIYSVAYGNKWLHGDFTQERKADERISLLVGRVCLGCCKDFGPRCRSERGDRYATAQGVRPGLTDDWGVALGRRGAPDIIFRRGPPRLEREAGDAIYDSVTGTEAQLDWTENPRLRRKGHEFGRQFVTFESSQAYPDFVLHLRRKPEVTASFRRAVEQEERGRRDESMRPYTQLRIEVEGKYVDGVYQQFIQHKIGRAHV